MSGGDLLIVEIPGFTPEMGRFVSMLNYVRSTTLAAIADLNVMDLDYLPDADGNFYRRASVPSCRRRSRLPGGYVLRSRPQ